jgi:hypothetical protein
MKNKLPWTALHIPDRNREASNNGTDSNRRQNIDSYRVSHETLASQPVMRMKEN